MCSSFSMFQSSPAYLRPTLASPMPVIVSLILTTAARLVTGRCGNSRRCSVVGRFSFLCEWSAFPGFSCRRLRSAGAGPCEQPDDRCDNCCDIRLPSPTGRVIPHPSSCSPLPVPVVSTVRPLPCPVSIPAVSSVRPRRVQRPSLPCPASVPAVSSARPCRVQRPSLPCPASVPAVSSARPCRVHCPASVPCRVQCPSPAVSSVRPLAATRTCTECGTVYLFISRHRHLPQKRGYSGVRVTVTINQRQVSWSQTYTLHTRSYAHSYTLTLPHSGRQEPVPLAPVCCWSMCLRSSLLNSRGFRSRMCCGNPLKAVTAE